VKTLIKGKKGFPGGGKGCAGGIKRSLQKEECCGLERPEKKKGNIRSVERKKSEYPGGKEG